MRTQPHALSRKRRWGAACLTACVCCGLTVASAETIRKKFTTTANPSLQLHGHTGTVSVKGWEQNEIDIQGESASEATEVIIVGGEHKVSIQAHPRRDRPTPDDARVDLRIRVPRQASVRLDSERGQIQVEGLEGNVTISGTSTTVTVSNVRGNVSVNTVDGPIRMQSTEGHIKAESIGGDVTFVQVNGPELRASTNSGRIRYEGDFGQGGTYTLSSYDAPIDILASARASFDLTARAVQGLIKSTLSFRPTPLGNPFRGLARDKYLQGRFNTGTSTVEITSFSGTIQVQGSGSASGATQ